MRTRFVILVAGVLLVRCSSLPPENLAPVGEIEAHPQPNLTGDYCYSGDPAALHAFGRGLGDLPFIDWPRVARGSVVRLVHDPGRSLEFEYTTDDGLSQAFEFDLTRRGVRWDGGRLVYRPVADASGARLGASSGKHEIDLYRFRDGRLVVHSMSSEAGLAFLVVPFRERYEVYLELAPAGPAGCEAFAPDGPAAAGVNPGGAS